MWTGRGSSRTISVTSALELYIVIVVYDDVDVVDPL